MKRWGIGAVLLALGAASAAIGAAWVTTSPDAVLLLPRGPARWIVYPRPGETLTRPSVVIAGEFRRSLVLDSPQERAYLRIRALRRARVWVNSCLAIDTGDSGNWKDEARAEVVSCLHVGENEISVQVENPAGPPALWLTLDLAGHVVVSDASWTASWGGSIERPAKLASEPMETPTLAARQEVPSSGRALIRHWRLVASATIGFALLASLLMWLHKRHRGWTLWAASSPWPCRLAVGAGALTWIAFFAHNLQFPRFFEGFDTAGHLEYVRHILERGEIPHAGQGWQMFQPPLYYALSALVLWLGGPPIPGSPVVMSLQLLGLAIAIVHVALVGLVLRAVHPDSPRRQVLGVGVTVTLPVMMYMSLAPGNEPLAAMLASAAILAGLHLMKRERRSWQLAALVGFLVGLATLAKVTGILVLLAILVALLIRAFLGPNQWRAGRLAEVMAATVAFLLTAGWDFLRVWRYTGRPFVGGWEARGRVGWWQDPGYRTAADFLRLGRAIDTPVFAGFGGFWDGLYSTLWADGMLSTWASPSLMSASLALAVIPTTAILAGMAFAVRGWVRRPSACEGLLLVLAAVTLTAMAAMAIRVPSVVSVKASYGLVALTPLAAFAAVGLDRAMGSSAWRTVGVLATAGAWAGLAMAPYWIDTASSKIRVGMALAQIQGGDVKRGAAQLQELATSASDGGSARLRIATLMLDNDAPPQSIAPVLAPDRDGPWTGEYCYVASRLAARSGDPDGALAWARRAVDREPALSVFRERLATLLTEAGWLDQASEEWRQALGCNVFSEMAHEALAAIYVRLGQGARGAQHRSWATQLARARARSWP